VLKGMSMKHLDEDMYELLVQQRNSAYLGMEKLQQALDNERRAHDYTRRRYEALLNSMAKHASLFANPPVVIVKESDLETGMRVAMDKLEKQ